VSKWTFFFLQTNKKTFKSDPWNFSFWLK